MFDLLIVGGGINGAGIARDAAGRGLSVLLVEKDDLASHTSSASTKLIHGGLRYLEHGDLRLVRESLVERERLLRIAPHIIWPLDFVLPQTHSPRPAWLVRAGLFLYDHLGGRKQLPATRTVRLATSPFGEGLRERKGKAFVYADCWVDDSRLVVLNAVDAAAHGAVIRTRCKLVSARRDGSSWLATLEGAKGPQQVRASALVNAAGPWVADVATRVRTRRTSDVRLVKGSHIVLPRLTTGAHALVLQNPDKRIVFALPFGLDSTLVGTTDMPWDDAPGPIEISEGETRYLLETVNRYFERRVTPADVRWSFAGIRPLYDDKSSNASTVTRDYRLDLDAGKDGRDAPMLSIYGGKITTYRRLAEQALRSLQPFMPNMGIAWTDTAPLPGGDIPGGDFETFVARLRGECPYLPPPLLRRLARSYGTRCGEILGAAQHMADLGEVFLADLTRAEVDYLIHREWARSSDDILFRRTKLGIQSPPEGRERLAAYLRGQGGLTPPPPITSTSG